MQNLQIPALTAGGRTRGEIDDCARQILNEVKLAHLDALPAGKLSGGQRKLLEIGMVMMNEPEVILLDEPFGGIHPELKTHLEKYLIQLRRRDKTILIVSHEMTSVFRMCRRLAVLHQGCVIADGAPDEVRNNEQVINAYLGGRDAA
jgi:ABC-type branched-subunit amino acid transport system ATPase component